MFLLSELATALQGTLHGDDIDCQVFSTDTRTLQTGDVFIALHGQHYDAEAFLNEALNKHASALVVRQYHADCPLPQLVVADTLKALGDIAHLYRQSLKANVIAITGSCGKTSVKGLLVSILSQAGKVSATKGNFNNQIGVPLTLLSAATDTDYLVVEAGTSYPGEIAYLSRIIASDISVLTNVHAAHYAGFGSMDAIMQEKLAIFNSSTTKDAVINASCFMSGEAHLQDKQRYVFGPCDTAASHAVYATNQQQDSHGCYQFDLNFLDTTFVVHLSVPGAHQVENALAAAAVALALNVEHASIQRGLFEYLGEKGRMYPLSTDKGRVIDDSYNANPASMKVAVDYLSGQSDSILVLGDMGELGDLTVSSHQEIGRYASEHKIGELLVVGDFAKHYADGFGEKTKIFHTHEAVSEYLIKRIAKETTVLIKGSRASRMDRICHNLNNIYPNNMDLNNTDLKKTDLKNKECKQ